MYFGIRVKSFKYFEVARGTLSHNVVSHVEVVEIYDIKNNRYYKY
jgi:hypothetical protein